MTLAFPKILAYQTAAAPESTPTTSAPASSAMSVNAGDSVYVFISYGTNSSGGISVSAVTDSHGNAYKRAGIVQNKTNTDYPAQEIWYADNVPANSALIVTVTFNSSTFFFFTAMDISDAASNGSLDAVSSGQTGNTTSSSDPITTSNLNDLVIANQCALRGIVTQSSGGGFTSIAGGVSGPNFPPPPPPLDLNSGLWYLDATTTGTYNSSLTNGTAEPYAMLTVAIKPASTWAQLSGKPYRTVSASGIANGLSAFANNGADYGPDTPGTTTSGIQEAMNFIANTGGTVYCTLGAYQASSGIYFTGPNQRLEFEAGCSLTFGNSATGVVPNYDTIIGFPCLIFMGSTLTASSPTPYSSQHFIGNNLTVNWGNNQSFDGFHIVNPGPMSSPSYSGAAGQDYVIEGVNSSGTLLNGVLKIYNYYQGTTGMTPTDFIRHVRVSRLYDLRGATTNGSGLVIIGGCAQSVLEDIEVDLSATSGIQSNCFVTGNAGETRQLEFRRCRFRANGSTGQVLEVQGNGRTSSTNVGTHDILFEACLFDSGALSGAPLGGSGGAYLDDTDNVSGAVGYVYNIEFRRCAWINCGMSFQSYGNKFGYLRFLGQPLAFGNSSLAQRGPNVSGPTVVLGSSPYTYQNFDGFPETVVIHGGSGVSIAQNGIATGLSQGSFILNPGDSVTVTYSTAPTVTKIAE